MTRLAAALLYLVLVGPLAAEAQPAGRVYRIGVLDAFGRSFQGNSWAPFRQALHERGYVEGRNLVVEFRSSEARAERMPALATELVKLNVDVIYAVTTAAALAAQKATTTVPIVFSLVGDPVGAGLVTSLARPGGNITGTTHMNKDLMGRRLQLLKEVVPNARLVAVLSNSGDPVTALDLVETELAARALTMRLQIVDARTPQDIDPAFSAMVSQRPAGLLLVPHVMYYNQRNQIVGLAARHRLPAIYESRAYADAGGLMSFGMTRNEFERLRRRNVALIDQILKGAKPADLPIEAPTLFELVINLKAAKALGLTIPQSVLLRADEVIQ